MGRGGRRPGAGAPKGQRKANKKQRYTTRLRPDQIAFLRTRNGAKTIEVLIDTLMGVDNEKKM